MQTTSSFPLMDAMQMRVLIFFVFFSDVVLVLSYLIFFLVGNPLGNDQPGMFDMNGEGNIPAWYSSMKLFAVAVCAYVYGRLVLLDDALAGWLILLAAALFAYLSMDEGATLHEKIGDRFNMLVSGTGDLKAKPVFDRTGMWMVFLGPPLLVALISGVIFLRKRLSIPTAVFVKAITGIVIFVVAAAPGDIVYNYVSGHTQTVQIAIEEFGEMVGVTLILWATLSLLVEKRAVVMSGIPSQVTTKRPVAAPPVLPHTRPGPQIGGAAAAEPMRASRRPS